MRNKPSRELHKRVIQSYQVVAVWSGGLGDVDCVVVVVAQDAVVLKVDFAQGEAHEQEQGGKDKAKEDADPE